MTATSAMSRPAFLASGAERSTGTWMARLGAAWDNNLSYRRTLAELRDLTDRQLVDLGISRGDLKRIAREAVYGIY